MLFFVLMLLGIWGGICTTATPKVQDVTVELAIFCDMEFGSFFQHNETKLKEYWAARIWVANLRFQMLPSVNIKFRVVSLQTFESKFQQPFIENNLYRNKSGNYLSISSVVPEFAAFVKSSDGTVKHADVVMLATGLGLSSTNESDRSIHPAGACKPESNAFVISVEKDLLWNNCGYLEAALAGVLGAAKVADRSLSGCSDWKKRLRGNCNEKHFFFSNCTDHGIANYVSSSQAQCLHRKNTNTKLNVLYSDIVPLKPPTLKEQCELLIGNSSVEIHKSESECVKTECHLQNNNGESQIVKKIYPMDNSPCGNQMSCFRGRCIQDGLQLFHPKSRKCLHSSDRFASNDTPYLVSCHKTPTPLDQVIILDKGEVGSYLATPYTTANANENLDKCLTVNSRNGITYEKCSKNDKYTTFGWEVNKVDNKIDGEVLVIHKSTGRCLNVANNGSLVTSFNCTNSNELAQWMFKLSEDLPTDLWSTSLAKLIYPSLANGLFTLVVLIYFHFLMF